TSGAEDARSPTPVAFGAMRGVWVEVAEPPTWIGGAEPRRSPKTGLSVIHLGPGQGFKARLEAVESLLLRGATCHLRRDDVVAWAGGGLGLDVKLEPEF